MAVIDGIVSAIRFLPLESRKSTRLHPFLASEWRPVTRPKGAVYGAGLKAPRPVTKSKRMGGSGYLNRNRRRLEDDDASTVRESRCRRPHSEWP